MDTKTFIGGFVKGLRKGKCGNLTVRPVDMGLDEMATVLYSYNAPIAILVYGEISLTPTYYSVTTSKHCGIVKSECVKAGMQVFMERDFVDAAPELDKPAVCE